MAGGGNGDDQSSGLSSNGNKLILSGMVTNPAVLANTNLLQSSTVMWTLDAGGPTGQAQVISFAAIPAVNYGDAPVTLNATTSSGLPITYTSSNPQVAAINGNVLTIIGAGSAVITATQAGNGQYLEATPVQQTLTVNKAALTATSDNK
ncbi:MAG: hypothetical protein ACKOYP_15245, partial [Bacteroidota bacterium]